MQAGEKYGRLTAVMFLENRGKRRDRPHWLFRCDCGVEHIANSYNVKIGATKSCGCLRLENKGPKVKHGHSVGKFTGKNTWSPTYMSWTAMKQRCTNPNYHAYHKYGGKGVNIEDMRWLKFENFLKDMGDRPSKKYSLDRIDNQKGYFKENCRWATAKEQMRNTSKTVYIDVGNERVKRIEYAESIGTRSETVGQRILHGWDAKDLKENKRHLNTGIMQGNEKNYKDEKKKIMELFKRSTKIVSTYLSVLDSRERQIIEMRFGLKTGKRMTLREIGEVENCTRERIRQIEAKAMEKMLRFYSELSY